MKQRIHKLITKTISPQSFSLILLSCFLVPCFMAASLVLFHVPTNKNQVISWRQLDKLKALEHPKDIQIAILGDSSAGNAIDVQYFAELTGKGTVNLALTGSIGLHGIILMAAHAKKDLPNLGYLYFVIAPTTWEKDLSPEAYFLLKKGLPKSQNPLRGLQEIQDAQKGYLNWLFTPKRLQWYWNTIKKEPHKRGIWSNKADYLVQGPQLTYKKASNVWTTPLHAPKEDLSPLFETWEKLCSDIKCVFAHGPIYEGVLQSSEQALEQIQTDINPLLSTFYFAENEYWFVGYDQLGDTRNHIKLELKNNSTRHYAELLLEN